MLEKFQTTENKNKAGHRNFRLLFYAYSIGFILVLFYGETSEASLKLYLYYCVFSALSQGLFTLKDIMNARAYFASNGKNGNGKTEETSPSV